MHSYEMNVTKYKTTRMDPPTRIYDRRDCEQQMKIEANDSIP